MQLEWFHGPDVHDGVGHSETLPRHPWDWTTAAAMSVTRAANSASNTQFTQKPPRLYIWHTRCVFVKAIDNAMRDPVNMIINASEHAADVLSFWSVHISNKTSVPGVLRNCFGCHQMWVRKMTKRTATLPTDKVDPPQWGSTLVGIHPTGDPPYRGSTLPGIHPTSIGDPSYWGSTLFQEGVGLTVRDACTARRTRAPGTPSAQHFRVVKQCLTHAHAHMSQASDSKAASVPLLM
eukprot:359344-Chlamydomonas_euryale.AAC.6